MTAKGRTVWKDKAAELEHELAHAREEVEAWRKLASVWRSKYTDLLDQVAMVEAQNLETVPPTVEAEDNGGDSDG